MAEAHPRTRVSGRPDPLRAEGQVASSGRPNRRGAGRRKPARLRRDTLRRERRPQTMTAVLRPGARPAADRSTPTRRPRRGSRARGAGPDADVTDADLVARLAGAGHLGSRRPLRPPRPRRLLARPPHLRRRESRRGRRAGGLPRAVARPGALRPQPGHRRELAAHPGAPQGRRRRPARGHPPSPPRAHRGARRRRDRGPALGRPRRARVGHRRARPRRAAPPARTSSARRSASPTTAATPSGRSPRSPASRSGR